MTLGGEALDRAIRACPEPPVLVGHSLGAVTIVHWAQGFRPRLPGALLVAPCDVDDAKGSAEIRSFTPVPISRLDFPTLAVLSSDDAYLSDRRALAFAHGWGARLALLGACGHINTQAALVPGPRVTRSCGSSSRWARWKASTSREPLRSRPMGGQRGSVRDCN